MRIGLFGLPGAGKGTQAKELSVHYSVPHISTGDMFRELQKGDSPLAKEIKAILASGQLVSDEMVTRITFERLARNDCRGGFLLDGYPRTIAQANALQESEHRLQGLLCIDVDKAEIIDRLSSRRVCGQCKSIFSTKTLAEGSKEICPKDGSKLIQRPDDQIESIKTRLLVFEENFQPIIKFFSDKGLLFHVDGNAEEKEVFARTVRVVDGIKATSK